LNPTANTFDLAGGGRSTELLKRAVETVEQPLPQRERREERGEEGIAERGTDSRVVLDFDDKSRV
jgi:hypothetical protein